MITHSLVGGPGAISKFQAYDLAYFFSRPKIRPEKARWPQFCEETAACGHKWKFLPTTVVRHIKQLFFMY
jgi:hypothetical protein